MLHLSDLGRLAAVLVYSGIFWGTGLFLIDACALDKKVSFLGVGLALAVMVIAVRLFVGVVAGPELFAMMR